MGLEAGTSYLQSGPGSNPAHLPAFPRETPGLFLTGGLLLLLVEPGLQTLTLVADSFSVF